MKPINAMELSVTADLSEASLEQALLDITKKLPKKGQGFYYGEVRVPSQLFSAAYILLNMNSFLKIQFKNIDLYPAIDMGYDVDEWSVTVTHWEFKNNSPQRIQYTVWSPGA